MKKIALFDICDTIVPFNSTYKFIEYLHPQKKFLHNYFIIKVLNKIAVKILRVDFIRKHNLKLLKGHSRSELLYKANAFIKKSKFNESIITEIKKLKNNGYSIQLLSATIEPIACQLSVYLNLDGYYSTTLKFNPDNICQGTIDDDLLSKKDKIFEKIKDENNFIVFFTDNKSDHNCISQCDRFIAVIPKGKKRNIHFWKKNNIKDIIEL